MNEICNFDALTQHNGSETFDPLSFELVEVKVVENIVNLKPWVCCVPAKVPPYITSGALNYVCSKT